jgi:endonuclease/exonuclease/phosphatase family metal-dependent hydrolase
MVRLRSFFRIPTFFVVCGCAAAVVLSSYVNVPAETRITDSVVPLIENIENVPPKKYSENHFSEIHAALDKKAQKVRIVTYNILFDIFDDQLKDKTHSWAERFPRVVKSIENMHPDVLCLQEVYPAQLRDLQNRIGDTFASFTGKSTTGELNAIFYNKERFELDLENYHDGSMNLSSDSLAMPINPKDDKIVAQISDFLPPELEPGTRLTMAHLRERHTGKRFAVISTHLTYYRINSREDQANFILAIVQKLHAQNKTVLLAGDFNSFPNRPDLTMLRFCDGDRIGRIFQAQLHNAKDAALLGHVGPLSTTTQDSLKSDSKPFEVVGTPGVILDRIYVSPEIEVIVSAIEPSRVDGHFPSDHLPVIADVLLP